MRPDAHTHNTRTQTHGHKHKHTHTHTQTHTHTKELKSLYMAGASWVRQKHVVTTIGLPLVTGWINCKFSAVTKFSASRNTTLLPQVGDSLSAQRSGNPFIPWFNLFTRDNSIWYKQWKVLSGCLEKVALGNTRGSSDFPEGRRQN